jgi:hypothetical protein
MFSEHASTLETDIARRRADQLGDRMLLAKLGHVEAQKRLFARVKHVRRQCFGQQRFTTSTWSEKLRETTRLVLNCDVCLCLCVL